MAAADAPPPPSLMRRLGVAPDDPFAAYCLYAVMAALAVACALGVAMIALGASVESNASLVLRANRYVHVFQNVKYVAGNVPTGTLRPSGLAERLIIYADFALYAAVLAVAVLFWTTVRSRPEPLPGPFALAVMGVALAAAALFLLTMLPMYRSACARAAKHRLMRTLFNNAVFNSLLDMPAFAGAMMVEGPAAALAALAAATEEGTTGGVETFVDEAQVRAALARGGDAAEAAVDAARAGFAAVLSRASAVAWKQVGPGFSRLYHAVADWATGVTRETVVDPLVPSTRANAWVSALVTLNVYDHLLRNVPRDSPLYQEAVAIFSRDDYERRGVDFYSFFVFGQYSVIENRASMHRDAIPEDLRAAVLRRVHTRMSIINGLCDKSSVGVLNASGVFYDFSAWLHRQVFAHGGALALAVAGSDHVARLALALARLAGLGLSA